MNNNDVICGCNNITVKDIKEHIKNGVTLFEQLQEKTQIGVYCPPCEEKSRTVFEALKEDGNL